MSKKILITGTSTGVGKALAVSLAQKGHTVWATMRNLAKKDALEAEAESAGVTAKLSIKQLDVEHTDSVNACVKDMLEKEGSIDVLINNAGAGFIRSVEQATYDELDWVMNINFMGTVRCIKAVIPHMRQARSGHIINVSSVGGLVGQPFNEMYCASKFAVEGLTESMASYMTAGFGIKFTSVEPGGISTEFASNVMEKVGKTGGVLQDEYAPMLGMYTAQFHARNSSDAAAAQEGEKKKPSSQTAQEVADVIIQCVENPEPPVRCRTSEWAEDFCNLKTSADPDGKKQQNAVARSALGAKSATEL